MNSFVKNIAVIIVAIVAFSFMTSVNASSAGGMSDDYQTTRISGNSMAPTLQSGSTAVVYKAYPFQNLHIGDVVIVSKAKGNSIIRLVRRAPDGSWVTQGDNNRRSDRQPLTPNNFGGLALVDQSMVRYQKYVDSQTPEVQVKQKTLVAQSKKRETKHNI